MLTIKIKKVQNPQNQNLSQTVISFEPYSLTFVTILLTKHASKQGNTRLSYDEKVRG